MWLTAKHLHSALRQETATTLIGMLLGMVFTQTFNGELQCQRLLAEGVVSLDFESLAMVLHTLPSIGSKGVLAFS